jgi:DNA-binding NarL/FixJ family response regulator
VIVPLRQGVLLDRESESEHIKKALNDGRRGNGALLVVEGPTGVGKSALLRLARGLALDSGALVLHAQADEFEGDFPFGVARQLLERWYIAASDDERTAAFAGAAKLAMPIFEYVRNGPLPDVSPADLHSVLHGLYWLCANLSARRHMVIVVDNVQWADECSLRFLSYLTRRLEEVPLVLAVARNSEFPCRADDIFSAMSSAPLARMLRPGELNEAAVGELVTQVWERQPDAGFVRLVHKITEGNPFLLVELLTEARRANAEPDDAHLDRLRGLVPRTVSQHVQRRLNGLPAPVARLAAAAAVFGDTAELRHCTTVADLDEAAGKQAAEVLVDAGILRAVAPPTFLSPMTRTALYESIPFQERERAHGRAARTLSEHHGPPRQVAEHLLHTLPGSDPWATGILREAARHALSQGAPAAAVSYLRRSLQEGAGGRAELLAELGAAELRAHDPEAVCDLRSALDLATNPRQRGVIGLDLGNALAATGLADEAVVLLRALAASLENADPDLAARLDARLLLTEQLATPCPPADCGRPARARHARAATRVGRMAARVCAMVEGLRRGGTAEELVRLADEVVAGGRLLGAHDSDAHPAYVAAWTLATCDRMDEADHLLMRAARHAESRGLRLAEQGLRCLRALVLCERGLLDEAQTETAEVLRTTGMTRVWGTVHPVAFGVMLLILIERDELDLAARRLAHTGLDREIPDAALFDLVLLARGRLRIARREVAEGLADILEYQRRCARWGSTSPRFPSPLPHAAVALIRLDRVEEARELAEVELRLARAFGAARPLATALRAAGLVTGGVPGLNMLAEAARIAANSPSMLERTHALVEYGAATRREGRRKEARDLLRSGINLARRCGATALTRRACGELSIAGGRVRRSAAGDGNSLTPSERRVADLAATGMRNQDIARELFVTVKTIEWHLSQVYPKLGISTRSELRNSLDGLHHGLGGAPAGN